MGSLSREPYITSMFLHLEHTGRESEGTKYQSLFLIHGRRRLTGRIHRRNMDYRSDESAPTPFPCQANQKTWTTTIVGLQRGGRLTGPMMVACHWNKLSPIGPAEQELGGSRPRSINSYKGRVSRLIGRMRKGRFTLLIRFNAMMLDPYTVVFWM